MSYTKVFSSIITSTIWSEDDQTRIIWITMLAIADRHGDVAGSVPGLARIASVPIEACRRALEKFMGPDPDSRTTDDEGRRIEKIEGGWHLLNYEKYREMATDEDRKLKAALRQQRARDRKKRNAGVTPPSHQIPQAEAEAEADKKRPPPREAPPSVSDKPPTVDDVLAYAKNNAAQILRTDVCMAWMDDRAATDWKLKGQGGNLYEFTDWRADLRKYHRIFLEHEADKRSRGTGGKPRIGERPPPTDPKPPGKW